MKKTIAILLIAIMALTALACTAKDPLIGTWQGDYDRITFNEDGTGIWAERGDVDRPFGEGEVFHYSTDDDQLTIEEDGTWTYKVNGDTLTFVLDGDSVSFTRQ